MKRVPHVYALLFLVIIFAALLTYVVPAGTYERFEDEETGRTLVDADSFEFVDSNPSGIMDVFEAVQLGLVESADIVFFIFVVGGAFGIIRGTGAIDAGLGLAVNKFQGREKLLFPALILIFSIGGGTFGLAEETIPFIPIAVLLCRQLGYDAMVGLAIVSVGARVGFAAGLMNPFTIGVAQGIAELPMFSGLLFRIVVYLLLLIASIWYVNRYAKKVKEDPTQSYVHDLEQQSLETMDSSNIPDFNKTHGAVLITVIIGFSTMIFGVFQHGWYINEISSIFLATGIIAGLVGSLGMNGVANKFVDGARELTLGALVVGVARGILVVMEDGQIIDTIIYSAGVTLETMPRVLAANGMFAFQWILNIFIPSGSGQAATTMPIMTPIADLADVSRQTAVLAYHYGDGFTNLITPTGGTLMASLAMANIPFERYFKWVLPLLGIWTVIGISAVTIATLIDFGPF
ncbi:YfcC family protein [Natranaerobius trueperi]|uniref:C4-dicarboxylate ABC transporter permease n=1 Tax=Natranaerobius trueperi TaxID=759412 RepID=A0A226BZI8_9FIRM|nr:AbgT family transporter [Natranaerobius trueperi]OWZ84406.1 C4-dicarboxylate ABC transporter permease [Natranaerobius trueperi]